jgi:hypothetical protein
MKKINTLVVLLGVFFSSYAQTPSLIETDVNAVQQVTHLEPGSGFPNYNLTLYYSFKGDTLIGGKTYHKHYCHKFWGGNGHIDEGVLYCGGYREEGKKIYFHHRDSTHESLFFDFGLTIGDTLPFRLWSNAWGPFYLVSVDSGLLRDGLKRRYLGISPFPPPWQNQAPFYEGIVIQMILPLRFIDNKSSEYTSPQTQLCKNGIELSPKVNFSWPLPNKLVCDYFVATKEADVDQNAFQVLPSLVHDQFSLVCPPAVYGKELWVRVYTSGGQVLKTIRVEASEKMDMDIGDLPNGPLFLHIWVDNRSFSERVFKY